MGKKCTRKRKFKTRELADAFAQDYMHRIALTFHPMASYYCHKHNSYHVGHNAYAKRMIAYDTELTKFSA